MRSQSDLGKVLLDGEVHANRGIKCLDSHSARLKIRKGATNTKMVVNYLGGAVVFVRTGEALCRS